MAITITIKDINMIAGGYLAIGLMDIGIPQEEFAGTDNQYSFNLV